MARFFVDPCQMQGDHILLTGENAQHAKVLRLKAGTASEIPIYRRPFWMVSR